MTAFKALLSLPFVLIMLYAGSMTVGFAGDPDESDSLTVKNPVNGLVVDTGHTLNSMHSSNSVTVSERTEPAATIEDWLSDGHHLRAGSVDTPELISFYAERQLGIAYKSGLLDASDEEQLVVTLEGSDCVIFVETSLALSMSTLNGHTSFDAFRNNLRLIRYRDGIVDGYASRLHYFSDWLATNEKKGLLSILFQDSDLPEIGPVYFMSENRVSYRHLVSSDNSYMRIKEIEEQLDSRRLKYIPGSLISEYESEFRTGDVLAFVTSIDGLDIIHTALIKMDGGRAVFYHASQTGSVIVDSKTIFEYLGNRSNIKGIIIARLN